MKIIEDKADRMKDPNAMTAEDIDEIMERGMSQEFLDERENLQVRRDTAGKLWILAFDSTISQWYKCRYKNVRG